MEYEDQIERKDFPTNWLYEKLESLNNNIKDSFKVGKKDKKVIKIKRYINNKLEYLHKKNIKIVNIKLGSKNKRRCYFLEKDFVSENLRRRESFIYNRAENIYEYNRNSIHNFFDYTKIICGYWKRK